MAKVAVIGAGIFGVTIALNFSEKNHNVTLFEKESEIMTKASGVNHYRHHYGYHYPRSQETVKETIVGQKSFEREYGFCILKPFPNFYSVVKEGSFVTPEQYIDFCETMNLPCNKVEPDSEIINPSRVALTLKVPERGYHPAALKTICLEKLASSSVEVKTNSEVVGGNVFSDPKTLEIKSDRVYKESFDFIIEATYANTNKVKRTLGIKPTLRQYELMELLKVWLPHKTFGAINMDGPFSSVMPLGNDGIFTITQARESVLERIVSEDFDDNLSSFNRFKNYSSNRKNIMRDSIEDFPILKKAKFLESMHITKCIKADVDDTDARPSEIVHHGNGVYSVFAGKIITCVEVANELLKRMENEKKD